MNKSSPKQINFNGWNWKERFDAGINKKLMGGSKDRRAQEEGLGRNRREGGKKEVRTSKFRSESEYT